MINGYQMPNGTKYFYLGIFHNYLVFIPAKKFIKYFSANTQINLWKSNGMLEENIENITKWDNTFARNFVNQYVLSSINFNRHCLMNNNISITKKVTNLNISYILNPWLKNLNTDF